MTMITITHVKKDSDGHGTIEKLKGLDGTVYTNKQIVDHIEAGGNAQTKNVSKAEIIVIKLLSKKWLKTVADTSFEDNLDNLPKF